MKILIVGSGGREHALAWKFSQSPRVEKIFAAPGNGGTAMEAKCENVPMAAEPSSAEGQEFLKEFALREKIDLSVIGPEAPLALGIADAFRSAGLAVIGPGRKAAQLESSKIYSKTFMSKYGIPCAKAEVFTDFEKALSYASEHFKSGKPNPLVIKADGLAAGKGVVISQGLVEAEAALTFFMERKGLGEAGSSVLLEDFIDGKETSILAAVSVAGGRGCILPFIPARDHKRRFEGGHGPNTGGMGAIAPVPDFSPAAQEDFARSILEPTLAGMIAEGLDYHGFIFFGLMVEADKCYLLEYNVRLGDPEAQAVLPLMDFDLADLCAAMLGGQGFPLRWKQGASCAPVAVTEGYPGPVKKGDPIAVDAEALAKAGAKLFVGGAHGGPPGLCTTGGRVLTVSALGATAEEAHAKAYAGMEAVKFDGMGFRRDIGQE